MSSLIDDRHIRVFISSTFRDMQDERDYLMKRTFPKLKQYAAERDVTLTELDLRWGITEEEAQTGKVVEICLREIDNSVPFFIGIIGNRYGWIPDEDAISSSVIERFSDVKGYLNDHLSVTEIEFQHGVLRRKEDMHAFFYIKEQIDNQDNPEMLSRLKAEVLASKYPSSYYTSIENLGEQVEDAFHKLLDSLFPEGKLSTLDKGRIGQRSFMNSLCLNYIKVQHNFDVLDEWASDWKRHQLVIMGASGLGKSALIANWVKEKLSEKKNEYNLVYHFTGNGGSKSSHEEIIQVLCEEIRNIYGFKPKNNVSTEKALEDLFLKVAAEGQTPLIIVLDAINQIADTENAKLLNWLPIPSKNIKILFSTISEDKTMIVFNNRHYPVFKLRPLKKTHRKELVKSYLNLFSKKLTESQVDRIISDCQCENTLVLKSLLNELINFGTYEKLDDRIEFYLHAETIEDFYQSLLESYECEFGRALVRHILSLLSVSRYGLSEDEILSILNSSQNCSKVTNLQWSQFYCSFITHFSICNGLILFSHNNIIKAVVDRYLRSDSQYELLCRNEIIHFFHAKRTRRAYNELSYQYFKSGNNKGLHKLLMNLDVFIELYTNDRFSLIKYWNKLKDAGHYTISEYLNLLQGKVPDYSIILSDFCLSCVSDPALSIAFLYDAESKIPAGKEQISLFWLLKNALCNNGELKKSLEYGLKSLEISKSLFGELHQDTLTSYSMVSSAYYFLDNYDKALEYGKKSLEIGKNIYGIKNGSITYSYDDVAEIYSAMANYNKALDLHKRSLSIRRAVLGENNSDTANSYSYVGQAYHNLCDLKKALRYQIKNLRSVIMLYGEDNPCTALSYENVAEAYVALCDYTNALKNQHKSLEIRKSIYGEVHYDTASSYNLLGIIYSDLCDFDNAISCQQKALKIMHAIFGENNLKVAEFYQFISFTYGKMHDYDKALKYQLKGLEINKNILGEQHTSTASIYNNVGHTYCDLGKYRKALKYYTKSLNIYKDIYGDNHTEIVMLYADISQAYSNLSYYNKALKYCLISLDISKELHGENNSITAMCYNYAGQAYGDVGNYDLALEHQLHSLNIVRLISGEYHSDTAFAYDQVGFTYTNLCDHDNARKCFLKSLEIYKLIYGNKNLNTANSYYLVGQSFNNAGSYEKSLEYCIKSLNIRNELGAIDDSITALSYYMVGEDYYILSDFESALKYLLEYLSIKTQLLQVDDEPTMITLYDMIGYSYGKCGDCQQFIDYELKALEIAEKIESADTVALIKDQLTLAYKMFECLAKNNINDSKP